MAEATPLSAPKIIGISLKMYFNPLQTTTYATALLPLLASLPASISLFLIPDFLTLAQTRALLPTSVTVGAQNCHSQDSGAFTGEVSPSSLKAAGCGIVELGHAERRRLFGETDEEVAKKAAAVLRNGMVPLICIGEKTRSSIISHVVGEVSSQILSILAATKDLVGGAAKEIIFAYEPVWAIGQKEPADARYVCDVVLGLRGLCEGRKVRFLYGGSAGPGTWEGLKGAVDGLFLGRFAHDVGNLREVIREVGAN